MFKIVIPTVLVLASATAAMAAQLPHPDQRTAELCGVDHENEIAQEGDGMLTSDGYYIASMKVVLDPRDTRVVPGFVDAPYLCTEAQEGEIVKFLFVPSAEWGANFAAP